LIRVARKSATIVITVSAILYQPLWWDVDFEIKSRLKAKMLEAISDNQRNIQHRKKVTGTLHLNQL
jgi:hypothetical protein